MAEESRQSRQGRMKGEVGYLRIAIWGWLEMERSGLQEGELIATVTALGAASARLTATFKDKRLTGRSGKRRIRQALEEVYREKG